MKQTAPFREVGTWSHSPSGVPGNPDSWEWVTRTGLADLAQNP